MVGTGFLDGVMIAEVAMLVLSIVVYFAHGAWLFLNQRRVERQISLGRESLARLLTRGSVNVEDMEALKQLPRDVQLRVFLDISRNVSGAGKERLRFGARELGLLDNARKLCHSRRWTRRLRGARLLARMDVSDPLVERLLFDRHPAVRAQAAEWAASHPSTEVIAKLLEMLADPATQARFAVKDALLRMGPVIAGPLADYLATHSGAPVESGLRVAEAVAQSVFRPVALKLSGDVDPDVRVAATNLLGAIGDAQCAERLTERLTDPESLVRAAAARGLGRMQYWQSAAQLAECLRDRTWRVRRDSALALRAIGAPGALFLRKALKGDDAFAADMAQLVMDLPVAAAGG